MLIMTEKLFMNLLKLHETDQEADKDLTANGLNPKRVIQCGIVYN